MNDEVKVEEAELQEVSEIVEAQAAAIAEELIANAEVSYTEVEPEFPEHNVKVVIKSLNFEVAPNSIYKAGKAYVVGSKLAKELAACGIADVVEDPCASEISIPEIQE